jgi:transposase, IS30 family
MKKTFKHLRQKDRDRLEAWFDAGGTQTSIAKILKVDKSTISREVRRRKKRNGKYDATTAQHKAGVKRSRSKFQGMKVEAHPELKAHIIGQLKKKRSPDEIAGRMKREGWKPWVGKDAIYRWLYSAWGQKYCHYLCTKRYRKRKQRKRVKREMIPNRVSIHERPLGATNKTRYKHFEADTAVAPRRAGNTHGVALASEIKTKLVVGIKVRSMACKEMTRAMKSFGRKVHMKSATLDNGIENRHHEKWGVPTFFADPHSPWHKPLIENTIGLLRRWFFKKGTDWSKVTEKQLQEALSTLNNKYRKSLNYASALEVASAHGIIKSDPNQKSCI